MKTHQTKPQPLATAPEPKPEINRAAFTRELLKDLNECHFDLLQTFANILKRNRGCSTPVEEFLYTLIHWYKFADKEGRGLTPDDADGTMEEFRENFEDAIEMSRWMTARYPDQAAGNAATLAAAPSGGPQPALAPQPEDLTWNHETPAECGYLLRMCDSEGEEVQEAWITRPEYIALKKRLADLRGLPWKNQE